MNWRPLTERETKRGSAHSEFKRAQEREPAPRDPRGRKGQCRIYVINRIASIPEIPACHRDLACDGAESRRDQRPETAPREPGPPREGRDTDRATRETRPAPLRTPSPLKHPVTRAGQSLRKQEDAGAHKFRGEPPPIRSPRRFTTTEISSVKVSLRIVRAVRRSELSPDPTRYERNVRAAGNGECSRSKRVSAGREKRGRYLSRWPRANRSYVNF